MPRRLSRAAALMIIAKRETKAMRAQRSGVRGFKSIANGHEEKRAKLVKEGVLANSSELATERRAQLFPDEMSDEDVRFKKGERDG